MEVEIAKKLFHGKEGYNCAQAVLKAFQGYNKLTDCDILKHKISGGGRAENGICGAIYAVKLQVSDEEEKLNIERSFTEAVGYISCKEIKLNKTASCEKYVGIAAKILKDKINATGGKK